MIRNILVDVKLLTFCILFFVLLRIFLFITNFIPLLDFFFRRDQYFLENGSKSRKDVLMQISHAFYNPIIEHFVKLPLLYLFDNQYIFLFFNCVLFYA